MSDSANSAPRAPHQIPESFFADLLVDGRVAAARPLPQIGQGKGQMYWYDSIIDDMFSHPGESLKSTALRLGRNPSTIYLIVNSDLFKARYAQRRDQFNSDLDQRMIGKLALVAEKALDHTIEALDKKRDSVPLPLLQEISSSALDRLGYAPREAQRDQPSVTVNANGAEVSVSVSGQALASARDKLQRFDSRAAAARLVGSSTSSQEDEVPASPPLFGGGSEAVVGDGSVDEESTDAL